MRADASPNEESRRKCTPERQAALRLGRRKEEMDVSSSRFAATLSIAVLLTACGSQPQPKSAPPSSATASASSAAAAVPSSGVASALASSVGKPGAPVLDETQRKQLDKTVAATVAALRPRLRYAVAAGDDGKAHLVVYDGEGLGADGRHPGKPHEYVVFRVINASNGEHYDPQQNSIVAPIPPPPQRDVTPN